jgi:hypothetical protein
MRKKEEYIDKLSNQLKVWSIKMDELTEKAEHKALKQKEKLRAEIAEFNVKHKKANLKLQQLKETTGDAWETLVEGMDEVWVDMKKTVHQIAEKFKQPR